MVHQDNIIVIEDKTIFITIARIHIRIIQSRYSLFSTNVPKIHLYESHDS